MYKKSPYYFLPLVMINICFKLLSQPLSYPTSKEERVIDEYHGHQISDPYRWLEEVENPNVQEWMNRQDMLLESFISKTEQYQSIHTRIQQLEDTGTNFGVPQKSGEYYYYNTWPKNERHAILHRRRGLAGDHKVVLDLNKILKAENLTYNGFSISPQGKYLALLINEDQSRWGQLWLYDIQKGVFLQDKIHGLTSAKVAWLQNDLAFYYVRYGSKGELAKNELNTSIHKHQIGSPQEKDQRVFHLPEAPTTLFGLFMNTEQDHLVIQAYQGRSDRNTVYLLSIKANAVAQGLAPAAEAALNYIGNQGSHYYFYSNKQAPNGKVVQINSEAPEHIKILIPEQDQVLAGGSTAGGNAMNFIDGKFVLLYREGTQQEIRIYENSGLLKSTIELETGWIGSGIQGATDGKEAWYTLNTFLDPSTVYRIDLRTGQSRDFFKRQLPIDKSDYVTRNTYYESFDGTKVPIYIVHKKGLEKTKGNPVYMYAYGFGGWVAVPWYQPHLLTWLDMGGIYVLPGVRGGGEFGDAWKEAGIRKNRPVAIKDYVAAAEFLVREGYTAAGRIVANGWSASGSLATAAVQKRPALFGAAMIGIPSLDLLRYTEFTPFKGWTMGYGSPAIEEEFNTLYQWSPYHNIKSNTIYPPMMVTVGEKDNTTPPQHGYKFVAAMQKHQQIEAAPTLLKIVWGGGHGFGTTSEQRRETYSQELYFLVEVLGLNLAFDGP